MGRRRVVGIRRKAFQRNRVELEVKRKRKMIWDVLSLSCWLGRKRAAYEYDRVLLLEEILPKPFAPRC